jgi:DNA polymerase III subunit delta'
VAAIPRRRAAAVTRSSQREQRPAGLPPVQGHEDVRAGLAAALAAGQLPNSLLMHGPAGVGKQRVALWTAQLLLCAAPGAAGPCDACQPCRMARRVEHPDLHWYFPLPRPKAAGPERLAEALEEARAAELVARRADPLRPTSPDGLAGIYLAHVQVLLRAAGTRPAMGSRKVFIVGDAEALVPQESSPEAANALLKLLEEPASDTTLILTASEPESLLPTIRSRLLAIRLRPLDDDAVTAFLQERGHATPDDARRAARLAQGSIGRALAFLPRDGEPGTLDAIRHAARDLLQAALDGPAAPRLAAALALSPAGARGAFSDTLESLTLWLRDLAAAAAGADELIANADAADWLRDRAARHAGILAGVPAAIRDVEATIQLAQLNINPQLALAALLRSLHRRLASGLEG